MEDKQKENEQKYKIEDKMRDVREIVKPWKIPKMPRRRTNL